MELSGEELRLFKAACADAGNRHARELMNLCGVDSPAGVLRHVKKVPIGIFMDVVAHMWYATLHQASREDARWGEVLERVHQ